MTSRVCSLSIIAALFTCDLAYLCFQKHDFGTGSLYFWIKYTEESLIFKHAKGKVIKTSGEGIRIRLWNTSNEIVFHKRIKLFTEKLKVRGHKIQMIKNILSEINFKDRQDKLKKKIKCENTCSITFITYYHAKAEILQRIIRKYWHLIKNYPIIGTKFRKNLTIRFKRNRNIGELVNRAIR